MSGSRMPGAPAQGASHDPDEAAQRAAEQGRLAGQQVAGETREAAGQIRQEAAGAVQDLKREGTDLAEDARDQALGFAESQQQRGAEQAEGLARAVHGAADQLRETSPQVAEYVQEAAGAMDRLARSLRDSSPAQLMGQVEDLARRQPVAFFGAAVLAGFALARFAKSSAEAGAHAGAAHAGALGGVRGAAHAGAAAPAADRSGTQAIGGGQAVPQNTAAGAPGWVQRGPDEAPKPATVAAASLGGAAARSTQQAGQTRPVTEAG